MKRKNIYGNNNNDKNIDGQLSERRKKANILYVVVSRPINSETFTNNHIKHIWNFSDSMYLL